MKVTFVTGNKHKAELLSRLLDFSITNRKLDLDEIQMVDVAEVGKHKAKQAYEIVKTPVLIDDFGAYFDSLGGLPGAFTKFFVDIDDGAEKMCRMLDSFDSRKAVVTSVMVFYDGTELKVFRGEVSGEIANHPRGDRGIGTDSIFIPEGYGGRTRAELEPDEYDEVYAMVRPIKAVREFLKERYG